MITFEPFWQLMEDRGITTYTLVYTYGMNPAEISRLRHDHNYTLRSIDRLCYMFSCQPGDILAYLSPDCFKIHKTLR
jgi:DNA-binding Xre family transcriptional regulator